MRALPVAALVFRRSNGGTVCLGASAVETILRHRQHRAGDPEAGGILLGRRILDTDDVVIDLASEPHIEDSRGRFRFFRKKEPAQRLVDTSWEQSKGTRNYLGEWHSHPEDDPAPSGLDLGEWQRIIATAVFEQDYLLFAIAGRKSVRMWELSRNKRLAVMSVVVPPLENDP